MSSNTAEKPAPLATVPPRALDTLSVSARDLEVALLEHDLARMSSGERLRFYAEVCRSLGLNPLTRPFGYILTDGKVRFYAQKDCTDQLRRIHHVTVEIVRREISDGVLTVSARASLPSGRHDEDDGCVDVANLRGTPRANANMKAVTKAKRRVTLSICGLGITDESEVDSIPGAQRLIETAEGQLVPAGGVAPLPSVEGVRIPPPIETQIRPLLERLDALDDLAAFDAEVLAIKAEAAGLSDIARKHLGHQAGQMRKALVAVSAEASEARAAMDREPDPAPVAEAPEQAAKRAEIAAALRPEDEPPSDDQQALALTERLSSAKTLAEYDAVWAVIQTSPEWKAATEGARSIAALNVAALRPAIADAAKSRGGRK